MHAKTYIKLLAAGVILTIINQYIGIVFILGVGITYMIKKDYMSEEEKLHE